MALHYGRSIGDCERAHFASVITFTANLGTEAGVSGIWRRERSQILEGESVRMFP